MDISAVCTRPIEMVLGSCLECGSLVQIAVDTFLKKKWLGKRLWAHLKLCFFLTGPVISPKSQRSWVALIDAAAICQFLIKSSQNDLLMGKRINGLDWGSISDKMFDINLVSKDKKGGRLAECIAGRKSGCGILHYSLPDQDLGPYWNPNSSNVGIIMMMSHQLTI